MPVSCRPARLCVLEWAFRLSGSAPSSTALAKLGMAWLLSAELKVLKGCPRTHRLWQADQLGLWRPNAGLAQGACPLQSLRGRKCSRAECHPALQCCSSVTAHCVGPPAVSLLPRRQDGAAGSPLQLTRVHQLHTPQVDTAAWCQHCAAPCSRAKLGDVEMLQPGQVQGMSLPHGAATHGAPCRQQQGLETSLACCSSPA